MTEAREIEVLFKNDQWMVQNDRGTVFLVEVLEDHPENLEGGYWVKAKDLAVITDSHNPLTHICEKSWVNPDQFERAARVAIALSGAKPNYDLDKEFAEARRYMECCR